MHIQRLPGQNIRLQAPTPGDSSEGPHNQSAPEGPDAEASSTTDGSQEAAGAVGRAQLAMQQEQELRDKTTDLIRTDADKTQSAVQKEQIIPLAMAGNCQGLMGVIRRGELTNSDLLEIKNPGDNTIWHIVAFLREDDIAIDTIKELWEAGMFPPEVAECYNAQNKTPIDTLAEYSNRLDILCELGVLNVEGKGSDRRITINPAPSASREVVSSEPEAAPGAARILDLAKNLNDPNRGLDDSIREIIDTARAANITSLRNILDSDGNSALYFIASSDENVPSQTIHRLWQAGLFSQEDFTAGCNGREDPLFRVLSDSQIDGLVSLNVLSWQTIEGETDGRQQLVFMPYDVNDGQQSLDREDSLELRIDFDVSGTEGGLSNPSATVDAQFDSLTMQILDQDVAPTAGSIPAELQQVYTQAGVNLLRAQLQEAEAAGRAARQAEIDSLNQALAAKQAELDQVHQNSQEVSEGHTRRSFLGTAAKGLGLVALGGGGYLLGGESASNRVQTTLGPILADIKKVEDDLTSLRDNAVRQVALNSIAGMKKNFVSIVRGDLPRFSRSSYEVALDELLRTHNMSKSQIQGLAELFPREQRQ
jgi:hypothetical protein